MRSGGNACCPDDIARQAAEDMAESDRCLNGVCVREDGQGGVISSIVLLTVAPLLGRVVLNFGPVEIFAVAVLGITIIGSLSQGSAILGLMSGAIFGRLAGNSAAAQVKGG